MTATHKQRQYTMDRSLLLAVLYFYMLPTLGHHRPRHRGTLRRLLPPLDDDQLYDCGPSIASTSSDAGASSVAPKTAAECAFAFLCASGELPEDYDARQMRKQQKKKTTEKKKRKGAARAAATPEKTTPHQRCRRNLRRTAREETLRSRRNRRLRPRNLLPRSLLLPRRP